MVQAEASFRSFRSFPYDECSIVQQNPTNKGKSFLNFLVSRLVPCKTVPEEVDDITQSNECDADTSFQEVRTDDDTALEARQDEEAFDEREFYDTASSLEGKDDVSAVSDLSGDVMIKQRYRCLRNEKKLLPTQQDEQQQDNEVSSCTELLICGAPQNNTCKALVTTKDHDALDFVFDLVENMVCGDDGTGSLEKAIKASLSAKKKENPVYLPRTNSILESSDRSDRSGSRNSRKKKRSSMSRSKKARATDASTGSLSYSASSASLPSRIKEEKPNNITEKTEDKKSVLRASKDYSSKVQDSSSSNKTTVTAASSSCYDTTTARADTTANSSRADTTATSPRAEEKSIGETTMSGTYDGMRQIGTVVFSESSSSSVSCIENDAWAGERVSVESTKPYQLAVMVLESISHLTSALTVSHRAKQLQEPVLKGFYFVACLGIFLLWPSHLKRNVVEKPTEKKESLLTLAGIIKSFSL